ncbi:alpha-1,2-fucosyltransferase [Candidatus Uhrbacteria bacterium]|nr:alpha-1,2-fucosyltransferase [Candidatus Uhrbacteria bacterium]
MLTVVRLKGGLGNQLFQYAAGRAIAVRNGSGLKLDITGYGDQAGLATPRTFALAPFVIQAGFANRDEIGGFIGKVSGWKGLVGRLWRKLRRKDTGVLEKVVSESGFGFDPEILGKRGDLYLDGFWQSEKYFSDIAETIRREFTLKKEGELLNTEIARRIGGKSGSVSLHVRRGDYVTDPNTNAYHGTCSPEYYGEAIGLIAEKVSNPHFFVFSDDIEWVKANIGIDYPVTYVSGEGRPDYEELRLMSYCRHNIIANSSFSWWGAWLNPNPDKIVIAPKRWFSGASQDTGDLIPESWIRI